MIKVKKKQTEKMDGFYKFYGEIPILPFKKQGNI